MLYLYFGYVGSQQSLWSLGGLRVYPVAFDQFYVAVNHVRFYSWGGTEVHCGIFTQINFDSQGFSQECQLFGNVLTGFERQVLMSVRRIFAVLVGTLVVGAMCEFFARIQKLARISDEYA